MKLQEFYKNRYEGVEYRSKNRTDHIFMLERNLRGINFRDKKVLDIGPGDGYVLKKIKSLSYGDSELFGIDLSKDNIDNLKKNNINAYELDISSEKTPFEDNKFDIIILNEVIEHVFDCQLAINEIYRILKKNGLFFIATHNSFNIFMRLKYLFGKIPTPSLDVTGPTMGEHIRLFNYEVLTRLLLRAGFNKKNIRNKSWFKYKKIRCYTGKLSSLFSRHFLLICKK